MQNGALLNGCATSCQTVGPSASPQWTSNGAPASPTMIAVDSNGSGAGYSPPIYYQVCIASDLPHDLPISFDCCHMGTAIKHPVPDRVKPSFVIFDIRAL